MPRLSDADYQALAGFRRALREFVAFSESAARGVGLTPQQHQALLALRGHAGATPTIGELAERLGLRHHSAVGLVDRMQDLGLLRRRPSREDRRRVLLELTLRGAAMLERLSLAHRRELRRVSPALRAALGRVSD